MAPVDDLAAVLVDVVDMALPVAARELAHIGVPVFPCLPGGKRPLTARGFHDATTDARQVGAWWREHPTANVGVPTGAASGFVVVDLDVREAVDGREAFDRAARSGLVRGIRGWQVMVGTPSGGLHIYYRARPDIVQRCWQAAGAGVDFRGHGGYVIVPPSTIVRDGGAAAYQVRAISPMVGAAVDSDALRDVLDPRAVHSPRPVVGAVGDSDVSRLAAWVAVRGEGERNRGLFWAACRLAEGGTSFDDALDALAPAAGHAGLGEREISTTIRSAYRSTHPQPRGAQGIALAGRDDRLDRSVTVEGRRL